MNNSTNLHETFSSTMSAFSTQVPGHIAIFIVTFAAISSVAGSFGNAKVCRMLRRRRDFRKVPHYLLANLALTGVLSALIHMPSLMAMTTVNYFQIRDVPVSVEILCKVGFPSGFAFIVLNALTLSLMALDRQDCVRRPFNRRLTTSNVKKIIPVIWILALATAMLFVIFMRNERAVCVKFYPYNNLSKEISGILLALIAAVGQMDTITIFILIVALVRIFKALRSPTVGPSVDANHQVNSRNRRQEKKVTESTLQIFGIFLLFRVPAKICVALVIAKVGGFQGTAANTANLISYVIVNFTYVANPFLHHRMLKVASPNRARQAVEPLELVVRARGNRNAGVEP